MTPTKKKLNKKKIEFKLIGTCRVSGQNHLGLFYRGQC